MSGFLEELQRRKVYRVAAAYIIAAGFIIQIGSAVLPAWELPNWTLRPVIVLLLAGFPVASRVLISEQIIDYRVATMIKGPLFSLAAVIPRQTSSKPAPSPTQDTTAFRARYFFLRYKDHPPHTTNLHS